MSCPCGAAAGTGLFCSRLCEASQARLGLIRTRTRYMFEWKYRRGPFAVNPLRLRKCRSRGARNHPCQVKGCEKGEIGFRRCRQHMLETGGATAAIVLEAA